MLELIMKLKNETGLSISEIKETLELCDYDEKMTVEYLKIKHSGVNYGNRSIMDVISTKG